MERQRRDESVLTDRPPSDFNRQRFLSWVRLNSSAATRRVFDFLFGLLGVVENGLVRLFGGRMYIVRKVDGLYTITECYVRSTKEIEYVEYVFDDSSLIPEAFRFSARGRHFESNRVCWFDSKGRIHLCYSTSPAWRWRDMFSGRHRRLLMNRSAQGEIQETKPKFHIVSSCVEDEKGVRSLPPSRKGKIAK